MSWSSRPRPFIVPIGRSPFDPAPRGGVSGPAGRPAAPAGRPAYGAPRAFAAGSPPGSAGNGRTQGLNTPNTPQAPQEPRTSEPQPKPADAAAAAYAAAQQSVPADADVTVEEERATPEEPEAPAEPTADAPSADPATADPAPAADRAPAADLDPVAAKAAKADEYLALAQRTQADFENYRKRASRDAAIAQERGLAKLAKELLPAIDNLDRAVQAVETFPVAGLDEGQAEAESQLASGIKLVQADVVAALARVGIEPFSPVGETFDPQHHEAVAQTPVPGATPGTVVEVYQRGYRLGDTILRPARVLVAA
jgi:molecular chaperone GrpE